MLEYFLSIFLRYFASKPTFFINCFCTRTKYFLSFFVLNFHWLRMLSLKFYKIQETIIPNFLGYFLPCLRTAIPSLPFPYLFSSPFPSSFSRAPALHVVLAGALSHPPFIERPFLPSFCLLLYSLCW